MSIGMAEPVDEEKPASIPSVLPQLTAMHLIALLLSLAALRYSREFLAPLFVAVLLAVALAPPVRQLSRVMPRWLASALVVIGIFSSFGFTAWLLSDEVAVFSRRLPAIVRDVRTTIQSASPRAVIRRATSRRNAAACASHMCATSTGCARRRCV